MPVTQITNNNTKYLTIFRKILYTSIPIKDIISIDMNGLEIRCIKDKLYINTYKKGSKNGLYLMFNKGKFASEGQYVNDLQEDIFKMYYLNESIEIIDQ